MSRHPSASVVIPAYNAARWIGATLDSWVAQTDRDFEVILVDDGSTDNTAAIAESYQDRLDIRVMREPPRGAPAGPCNVGTRAARGELILPCDADDMATPERLARVRAAWHSVSRMDCLLFTDFAEVDSRGATVTESALAKYPSLAQVATSPLPDGVALMSSEAAFTALISTGCFIRPIATAIPRRVIEAVDGYDEQLRNGQDYDIFVRIAWEFPFVWMKEKLALYRLSQGNISSRPVASVVPSRLRVLERLLQLPLRRDQAVSVRHRMSENFEALAFDQGVRGHTGESLLAYLRAFRNWPQGRLLRGMASALVKGLARGRKTPSTSPG
jgi:glycosyltransferase involved in cell wall biosynthesis